MILQDLKVLLRRTWVGDESEIRSARLLISVPPPRRHADREVPYLCLPRKVLDGGRVEEGKLQTRSAHACRENEEQSSKDQHQYPMNVEKPMFLAPAPGEVIRHHHQSMQTKQRCPTRELYEEFEGGFRHDATNPRAKVIHLQHTSTQFTAVVRAVWLVIVAC